MNSIHILEISTFTSCNPKNLIDRMVNNIQDFGQRLSSVGCNITTYPDWLGVLEASLNNTRKKWLVIIKSNRFQTPTIQKTNFCNKKYLASSPVNF